MSRKLLVVAGALVVAVAVDLVTGAAVPGRMAVFSLAATFLLVLGAKWLGRAGLQQPVGRRPGELPEQPAVAAPTIDQAREVDRG